MVDIINLSLGVHQLDKIFNNMYNVLAGEHAHVGSCVQSELAVDAVAAHVAEVITFL